MIEWLDYSGQTNIDCNINIDIDIDIDIDIESISDNIRWDEIRWDKMGWDKCNHEVKWNEMKWHFNSDKRFTHDTCINRALRYVIAWERLLLLWFGSYSITFSRYKMKFA